MQAVNSAGWINTLLLSLKNSLWLIQELAAKGF